VASLPHLPSPSQKKTTGRSFVAVLRQEPRQSRDKSRRTCNLAATIAARGTSPAPWPPQMLLQECPELARTTCPRRSPIFVHRTVRGPDRPQSPGGEAGRRIQLHCVQKSGPFGAGFLHTVGLEPGFARRALGPVGSPDGDRVQKSGSDLAMLSAESPLLRVSFGSAFNSSKSWDTIWTPLPTPRDMHGSSLDRFVKE
jgi:hypothetical protein